MLGYKRPLVLDDFYDLSKANKARTAFEKFDNIWTFNPDGDNRRPKSRFFLALFGGYWRQILTTAFLKLIDVLLMFVNPVMLNNLLKWIPDTSQPLWHGLLYAIIIFIASLLQSLIHNQFEYIVDTTGLLMNTGTRDAIYRKSLKLSAESRAEQSSGEIANLMSIDAYRIIEFTQNGQNIWAAPLEITIAMYLLWRQLGLATFAGVAVMIALLPVNGWAAAKWKQTYETMMKQKDVRSKLMSEILTGIKAIKLYAWEDSFKDKVRKARLVETNQLKRQSVYVTMNMFTMNAAGVLVAMASFLTYGLINGGQVLDASKAFVSLSLFNLLRNPLVSVPSLVTTSSMVRFCC